MGLLKAQMKIKHNKRQQELAKCFRNTWAPIKSATIQQPYHLIRMI